MRFVDFLLLLSSSFFTSFPSLFFSLLLFPLFLFFPFSSASFFFPPPSSLFDYCDYICDYISCSLAGFGVTPAVLSKVGAMAVVGRLKFLHDSSTAAAAATAATAATSEGGGGWESALLSSWESEWWSEYTLYRMGLDFLGIFDTLHAAFDDVELSCWNVWWEGDLPWQAEKAMAGGERRRRRETCGGGRGEEGGGGAEAACEYEKKCLFSVVQSTAGADVGTIARQLAPFIKATDEGGKESAAS